MRSIRRGPSLKISYITINIKDDFPYWGRPDLHLFEPTLESFKRQTMKDIEWVVVDTHYNKRKGFFKDMDLPFVVKHVPARPDVWFDNNFPGVSTQFNKGIIHADGKLLFFGVDGFMFGSDFMEKLWSRYQEGYFPMAWYLLDWSYVTEKDMPHSSQMKTAKDFGVSYNFSGYTGEVIEHDQRYNYFKEKDVDYMPPWTWWFACSSASMEAVLTLNGWDQSMDGDKTLMDVDFGSRLELARFGIRTALFRDLFLVRAPSTYSFFKSSPSIKCNYGLVELSRNLRRYEANRHKITDDDINWIKKIFCEGLCGNRDFCRKNHKWQFPFQHKKTHDHPNCSQELFDFWKDHVELIDLKKERQLRIEGKKYTEGTFVV